MSKLNELSIPFSLSQHFDAPDGFRGCFGWVCGYSADVPFLEDAVERFTRRTRAQRAYSGCVAMALMLDPRNAQIQPAQVPGVLHLPINSVSLPFRLMHAKVALLGFQRESDEDHESDEDEWQLRLIVSTGNWTRGTLEDSLDLAWRIDLCNSDLKVRDAEVRQARADDRPARRDCESSALRRR